MNDANRSTLKFAGEIRARVQMGWRGGVLWIHGYTVDSTIWDELWSLLPDWSHYGIDLPGHGTSPPLKPGTTLKQLGQQLAEAAAGCGIRHVVGLSLGTIVALELTMSRPKAFATLTLGAPALANGPVEPDVGVRYKELVDLYRRRGSGHWMTDLWMRCPPMTFAHTSATLRARLAEVIDRHAWSELRDPESGIVALTRQTQDPRALAFSTARQLYLIGEHELPAFRSTATILSGIRPDARCIELSGAGHLCMLHVPKQAARLLAEHWDPPNKAKVQSTS
jgi:2-succinyl-6-hydroxy-2,4-cyclohexadiene-1-carboxylate synthase